MTCVKTNLFFLFLLLIAITVARRAAPSTNELDEFDDEDLGSSTILDTELEEDDEFDDEFDEATRRRDRRTSKQRRKQKRKTAQKKANRGILDDDDDADDDGDAFDSGSLKSNSRSSAEPSVLRVLQKRDWTYEFFALGLCVVYVLNYFYGAYVNKNIAKSFWTAHKDELQRNFSHVGLKPVFPGEKSKVLEDPVVDMSPNCFRIYCTGRESCLGLILCLDLCPRQDLLSVILNFFLGAQGSRDTLTVEVPMISSGKGAMDSFLFALCSKTSITDLKNDRDIQDLAPKTLSKQVMQSLAPHLPKRFSVFSDAQELLPDFLDQKTLSLLQQFEKDIHLVKFTDSEAPNMDPDSPRLSPQNLRFQFNFFPKTKEGKESLDSFHGTLLQFVFHCVDRLGSNLRVPPIAAKRVKKRREELRKAIEMALNAEEEEEAAKKLEEKRRADKEEERAKYEKMTRKQKKAYDLARDKKLAKAKKKSMFKKRVRKA
eukprot:g6090.t1